MKNMHRQLIRISAISSCFSACLLADTPEKTQIFAGGIWNQVNAYSLESRLDYEVKPANLELSKFGGWKAKKFDSGTGFFRVQMINGRWWAIDPEGYLFIHKAINSVTLNNHTADQIYQNLRNYGFNGFGNWSDENIVSQSSVKNTMPMAYTPKYSFLASYRQNRQSLAGRPRIELPVFDTQFVAFANAAALEFAPYENDPHVFGYFSDNELPFKEALAEHLALTDLTDPNYIFAINFLQGRGKTPATYNNDDLNAYMGELAERYYSIVSAAIKAVDSNHLYLGTRCHSAEKESQAFMTNAGKYVDVFSTNFYNRWGKCLNDTKTMSTWSGRPLIFSEFYTRGADTGMAISGAGFEGINQRTRALFYQNFVSSFLETKHVIGFHWFKFDDEVDANKGLYRATGQVYDELANSMKIMNDQLYDYIDHLDSRPPPAVKLEPDADAYFLQNTNYGNDADLKIKENATTLRRSYLRFNVSGISQPIRKAYISLKSTSLSSYIGAYRAEFVADDSWGETTIIKNNAPVGSGTLYTWGFGRRDLMIDVTQYVKQEIAGDGKISIRLVNDLDNGTVPSWASKEHADVDLRPELIIYAVDTNNPYDVWAAAKSSHPGVETSNPDKDSLTNLSEFAFGLDPNVYDSLSLEFNTSSSLLTRRGIPTVIKNSSGQGGVDPKVYFIRRKGSSIDYSMWFSTDLGSWIHVTDPPTVMADDGDYEVISAPFPQSLPPSNTKARFFKLGVNQN